MARGVIGLPRKEFGNHRYLEGFYAIAFEETANLGKVFIILIRRTTPKRLQRTRRPTDIRSFEAASNFVRVRRVLSALERREREMNVDRSLKNKKYQRQALAAQARARAVIALPMPTADVKRR